jgi:replicative DNA helicase
MATQDSPSLEIQYKLLGEYMNNSLAFEPVENLIRPNIFTTPILVKSYEIIKQYHQNGVKPDIMLLYKSLTKAGFNQKDAAEASKLGELSYLSEKQVVEYVDILFKDYVALYLSNAFKSAINNFSAADPLEVMNKAKDAITTVELVLNNVSRDKSIKVQFREAVSRIKDLKSGVIEQPGFSWGLPSLDKKTIGIVHGINIVAATKGGGKSSLLINIIVHNVIKKKLPLLFFSLEMSAIEVLTNVIANVKRINSRALRTGDVDDENILSIEQMESSLNDSFVIDETGGITWQYFEAKVKAFRRKNKIPPNQTMLVLLDYLGLMKNSRDESRMSKEEKIEQICNELMRICKNENIALVKLAQFSREGDKRGNDKFNVKTTEDELKAFRPRMSDLKGSAAIESNAITILLLYRPDYYGIYESNKIGNLRGLCEINVPKGRYVEPGPLYVKFTGKYNLFEDHNLEESGIISSSEPTF